MTQRIRAWRRAGSRALLVSSMALGTPGPGVAQQSPIGVTSELFDSAFHARIDAPSVRRGSGMPRFLDGRAAWLLLAGLASAIVLWRRRMPMVRAHIAGLLSPGPRSGRRRRARKATAEVVIRGGEADEAWRARLRPKRKEPESVPLPPHVARILSRNAMARSDGAEPAEATSANGPPTRGRDAPPRPPTPGSVDLRVPGWGPRGEKRE